MCGICGFIGNGIEEKLENMTSAISHRGPNSSGTKQFLSTPFSRRGGLGHRRLSIIDISSDGIQPMSNEDDTVWIVFNGEIYNYRPLRKQLIQLGHRFKSETDTEVILHLYEEYGEKCLDHLNGMFAFAIWDTRQNKLFAARDRLGIKPFFYMLSHERFVFGSEIKCILASMDKTPDVNWQAISDYFNFLYVPNPQTAFDGIQQLKPGHYMIIHLGSLECQINCYWDAQHFIPQSGNFDSTIDFPREIERILAESVEMQLISDVPLGVFLSGGIDSTVLTALAARSTSERIKTFTVAFQGKGVEFYNEQEYARMVADHYHTEHHEILIDLNNVEEILSLISCFDQPFGNPTFFLNYLISKFTKEHVTVALSGAGGDELFAGYPRYKGIDLARKFKWVPPSLMRIAGKSTNLVTDSFKSPTLRRAKLFFEGFHSDFAKQYGAWTYYYPNDMKNRLVPSLYKEQLPFERIISQYLQDENLDFDSKVEYLDLRSFLVDNILEYSDRSSMAVGFEVRVPFLDHRLVELSLQIPFSQKLKNGQSKAILKETFRDLIPGPVLNGEKRGFCPPLAFWMRDVLDFYFETQMTKQHIQRQGIFSYDMIQTLRNQHKSGKRDNSMELFGIIMFDVWFKKYIEGVNI